MLGAIRLLHQAGFDPLVISDVPGIARKSRWFRHAPPSRSTADPAEHLADYLNGLPVPRAPLLPCSDAWMFRVARCAPEITERFPASISSAETINRIIDKWRLAELMQELQLPHPRTFALDATKAAPDFPAETLAAAFIKPRDSARFLHEFGVKGFHVRSRDELSAHLSRIAPTGLTVQLQEYIPGPPDHHFYVEGFIDRHGNMPALFLRKRLRMYPPDFGNSTLFESIAVTSYPDAVHTVQRLLSHVGYRGVFSVEFKYDGRDGISRLIEVNARPWWFIEFAGQCGLNVAEMSVRDALGESVPAVGTYRVGRRCVYPYYDYAACRALHREGKLSLAAWLASWATATQPVFRWSDPMPAITATTTILGGRVARLLGMRGR